MASDYTAAKMNEVFGGTFECRACGFEAPATVSASGRGSAQGHGHDAAQIALEDAEADANAVAARRLTFVPCPRCGVVDRSARSYRIQVIVGSLFLGAVVGLVAFFFMHRKLYNDSDRQMARTLGMIIAGVVAVSLYAWWGRPWWGVKSRVRIDVAAGKIVPRDD